MGLLSPYCSPTTVTTISATGTSPGTVIIETLAPSTITVTRPYTGTAPLAAPTTVTTVSATGTLPATVIIGTLAPKTITATRPHPGSVPIHSPTTVMTVSATGTNPATVIVETPAPTTITVTRPYTGSSTLAGPRRRRSPSQAARAPPPQRAPALLILANLPGYPSLDPEYFKKDTPLAQDLRHNVYINDDGENKTLANAAAVFRTFMYACEGCTYQFESPYSDDVTIMWFGDHAYSGSTRENADITQSYYGNDERIIVNKTIKAGTYYPIRILWGNTETAADLQLWITAPDGDRLGGESLHDSEFLVREACDGSYAPFPPFGHET
ncbi:hypothetical protein PWT90_10257 [Aphanocladium album]|nr:hypothetical protein PWT90_10257 [Aphanocladium album]